MLRIAATCCCAAVLGACAAHPAVTPPPPPPPPAPHAPPALPTVQAVDSALVTDATPEPTREPYVRPSPLFVDGAAHRIYASGSLSGTARLAVYDTRDGRLIDSVPIDIDERMIDIDRERGRLYMYRPSIGVRMLDAAALTETAVVSLPTPDEADNVSESYFPRAEWSVPPIVHPTTRQLLTVAGTRVRFHDGTTGEGVDAIDLPRAGSEGPIIRASLSADGRLLYAALADPRLGSFQSTSGAVILGFDLRTRRLIERRNWRGPITHWQAWDRSLYIEADLYKDIGAREALWIDGHERRRIVGASFQHRAVDMRRNRLLGTFGGSGGAALLSLGVSDAATLDLLFQARTRVDVSPEMEVSLQDMAYDAVTDHLFALGSTTEKPYPMRMFTIDAAGIAPEPASADEPTRPQVAWVSDVVQSFAGATGEPLAYMGGVTHTIGAGTPTPMYQDDIEYLEAIRRADDQGWTYNRPAGLPLRLDDVVAAPRGADDGDVADSSGKAAPYFTLQDGIGVFRSDDAGRSWRPSSVGIDALGVRELHVSPDFARDGTLFAASFTTAARPTPQVPATNYFEDDYHYGGGYGDGGDVDPVIDDDDPPASTWRSRDGGAHWTAVGRFVAIAVSPAYAVDRTVGAFEHGGGRFYLSKDGGDHWQPRGALPADPKSWMASPVAGTTWAIAPTDGRPRIWLALATIDTGFGGGMHWPESGARLYRSTDDGRSWELAWDAEREADNDARPRSMTSTRQPLLVAPDALLLPCVASIDPGGWTNATLLSHDGGLTWRPFHLATDPDACPLAVLPDGRIVTEGYWRDGPTTVGLDAFVPGIPAPATETPWPVATTSLAR
ncbi:MAG: sialidase family protein [Ardenticatenales bacterium]